MYRHIDDFINDWALESESTVKIFNTLTDASLSEHPLGYKRSLGRLAWHITQTVSEMMFRAGLFDSDELEHIGQPATAAEITGYYKKYAEQLTQNIRQRWTDGTLLEFRDMYGEQWHNGITLAILIRHMSHHRGQMTVLMRQLGLKVPGVYGPSAEEWVSYGMQPME